MVDFAADSLIETYKNLDIMRKPHDPYGGAGQYYFMFGNGERSELYSDLSELKRYIDARVTEASVWHDV
ncbi:hypothetical protein V3H56_00070 [Pseudomonas sp. MS646]|uniref:hypothetical protein n=1 Tax=Pseudomonas sp. MS646 TaxID=3118751 RepID=UPI0030CC16D4